MPDKLIVDRKRAADWVRQSVDTHRDQIVAGLTTRFAPLLPEGQAAPDYALLVSLLEAELKRERDTMWQASSAHEAELDDDSAPRATRDAALDTLQSSCVAVRGAFFGIYGPSGAALLAMAPSVPRDPDQKIAWAYKVAERLRDPSVVLPAPSIPDASLDRDLFASTLTTHAAGAEQALAAVAREAREAETTQTAKWAATDRYDASFSDVARTLESLYRLAGLHDLADRIRPSRRSPGRLLQDEQEPTPEGTPEQP